MIILVANEPFPSTRSRGDPEDELADVTNPSLFPLILWFPSLVFVTRKRTGVGIERELFLSEHLKVMPTTRVRSESAERRTLTGRTGGRGSRISRRILGPSAPRDAASDAPDSLRCGSRPPRGNTT